MRTLLDQTSGAILVLAAIIIISMVLWDASGWGTFSPGGDFDSVPSRVHNDSLEHHASRFTNPGSLLQTSPTARFTPPLLPPPPVPFIAKDASEPPALPPLVGPLARSAVERKQAAVTMATAMIGPLLDSMRLPSGKKALVLDVLASHQTRIEDTMIGLHQGKPPTSLEELKAIDQSRDQSLVEILGDSDFKNFEELVTTRVERELVTALSEHLNQAGEPLTSAQESDLLSAMIPAYREAQSRAQDVSRAGIVSRRMDTLASVLQTTSTELSATQKQAINSFIEKQKEAGRKGL